MTSTPITPTTPSMASSSASPPVASAPVDAMADGGAVDLAPVLAIDIGGTKLAVGVVVGDTLVTSARAATPQAPEVETFAALTALIDQVLADTTEVPTRVGIGCGGPMQWPEGVVSPLNIHGWRDFPLRARIEEHVGVPARIHNDAVCFALAEFHMGAGRGHDHMLGMVVSTGVGGGLVSGGRAIDGRTGNAGHVGHVVVDPQGRPCPCGGRGCLEAEARGPVLAQKAQARGWTGLTARELADDARAGDPIARDVLARAGEHIGIALASVVGLLDISAVVIGGGVSQSGEPLWGPLRESYRAYAGLPWCREVLITPAAATPEPGLLGAAALWR